MLPMLGGLIWVNNLKPLKSLLLSKIFKPKSIELWVRKTIPLLGVPNLERFLFGINITYSKGIKQKW